MSFNDDTLQRLLDVAIKAALAAGQIIQSYTPEHVIVDYKDVGTSVASQVVTEVDLRAQNAIIDVLKASCSTYNLALLSEETADDGQRHHQPAFWCIDPMDGTLAFVKNTAGYSVSIALVSQSGDPLIGVVYDPVENTLFHAVHGQGAYKNQRLINTPVLDPSLPLILQVDNSFKNHPWFDKTLEGLTKIAQVMGLKGAAIQHRIGAVMNACAVLESVNTCYFKYPRRGNSGGSVWDYAATACLFKEAGMVAVDILGGRMDLNRKGSTYMNHRGVLYAGISVLADEILGLYRHHASDQQYKG